MSHDESSEGESNRNNNLFFQACRHGDLAAVRKLLALAGDAAVQVNAVSERAFISACKYGHIDIVRELLSLTRARAVNVHARNTAALAAACEHGHVDVVRELLALTGDRELDVHAENERAFVLACDEGHIEVVRELLALSGQRRVNVHADNECAFRLAVRGRHLVVVRELLALTGDRAVDVHAEDDSAFRRACSRNNTPVVRLLLQREGCSWDAEKQQAMIAFQLSWAMFCNLGLAMALLQSTPLPAIWLHEASQPQHGILHQTISAQEACAVSAACWPLVQQVLLAAVIRHHIVSRDRYSALMMPDMIALKPAAVVLCCSLPGPHFDGLRRATLPRLSHAPGGDSGSGTDEDMYDHGAHQIVRFYREAAWRGVAVPLTPDVPGADIARAHLGALSRPGRRAMVLRRAARRATILQRAARQPRQSADIPAGH